MKFTLLFLLLAFVGFFAVFVFGSWNQKQGVQKAKKSVNMGSKIIPFFVEEAPAKSLRAEIVSMKGDVVWESRIASTSSPLESSVVLQQGEFIETGENAGMTISFPTAAELIVGENAKLSFLQTLPENILFGQSAGAVSYTNLTDFPLSVRSLHLLIAQEKGSMTVNVDADENIVSVLVNEGELDIAYNDLENIVSKTTLSLGQEYFFDDGTRTGEVIE